jgi:cellulose synthase/poly-beta-1,6-N-acetylglucosamine synthase-like glycosyltransferase
MNVWTQLINYRRSRVIAILSLPLGLLAEVNYRCLPRLPIMISTGQLPSLSIIIPARDEMENLGTLLPSLQALSYTGDIEILIIDDHSRDNTSGMAESFGLRVVRLDQELPDGWKGKPFACHQGALMARGDWFLFIDADTVHTPNGITRAVNYAERSNLDGLSLFLDHQASSWLDKLAIDTAFAGLFTSWHASKHLLNGQFILIRKNVYFESGGFESVRDQALEDVALGNLVEGFGYNFQIMTGEDVAKVRMYNSYEKMFYGLSRLEAGVLSWQGLWAGLPALYVTALVSPIITLAGVLVGKLKWFWFPITWGSASLSLLPWARRSGSGWLAILAPLGAMIVLLTAIFGLLSSLLGTGIPWKDRKV